MKLLACTAAALAAATVAAAKPPPAGVLVPGRSLGGLHLGMTPAQVRAAWGSDFGTCRRCRNPTWYYNYAPFTPKGAGVEFRRNRVAAIFTLWSPSSWHTPKRLRIGDAVARVTELYGALPRLECGGYYALTQPGPVTTAFYIRAEKVWGFGLSRASVPACR
ncbi:MAG: hypothetical protein ABR521_13995 [Gaiellaceae bacterium]